MHRVSFFFIGADRAGMIEAVQKGRMPDSGLRGANFFAKGGQWEVEVISTEQLEKRLPRVLRAFLPMSLVQLALTPRLLWYDAVVASDAFLLGALVSLLGKTKWIFVAINSSVLIERHAKHTLRRAVLRWCWGRYAAIVCLSDAQRRDLIAFGIRESRLQVIHFGVDTMYFAGTPAHESGPILAVGKDIGRDYTTLIEVAELTGLPVEIIASRKNLRDTKCPSNVTIRYDLPLEELREAYARARFVVVTSLPDSTALGTDCSGQTVVLEALASRRAVIATERAWLAEYLTEGEDYLAVPAGDASALAGAMQKLSEDAPLRERLAAHGQSTVRGRYSSQRFADGLKKVVERALL